MPTPQHRRPPAGRARPGSSRGGASNRGRVVALGLLLAWAAALASGIVGASARGMTPGPNLLDLSSRQAAVSTLLGLGAWAVLESLRFVPLGLLAVFAWPDRPRWHQRVVRVAAPAFLLAVVVALLALGVRATGGGVALPGPLDCVLPGLGIALGVAAGSSWRRGPWARVLFLPKLVLLVGGVALLAGGLVWSNLEPEPAAPEPPVVDSAGKRQIWAALRGKDPREVPDGETRTLQLTSKEIDFVFAWTAPLILGPDRARLAVDLREPDHAGAQLSLRLPLVGRWLNARGSTALRIRQGRLDLGEPSLRLGRLDVPEILLAWASPLVELFLEQDRRLRPALAITDALVIEADRVAVTYRRLETPPGLLARLLWGEGAKGQMEVAVAAHARHLLDVAPRLPPGDAGFGEALEAAFELARERSAASSGVVENQAAILALGVLFGHPRLEPFVGQVLDEADRDRARRLRGLKLRGRGDWPRHYLVSAALAVLSAEAPSNAVGLLKEELDAGGGSGFSFADLLADRAGTAFGLAATRDEMAAGSMQGRLEAGFVLDDFFPEADDLPEGLQDRELQARYGGVGGSGYQELLEEIDRRVAACPALRS